MDVAARQCFARGRQAAASLFAEACGALYRAPRKLSALVFFCITSFPVLHAQPDGPKITVSFYLIFSASSRRLQNGLEAVRKTVALGGRVGSTPSCGIFILATWTGPFLSGPIYRLSLFASGRLG